MARGSKRTLGVAGGGGTAGRMLLAQLLLAAAGTSGVTGSHGVGFVTTCTHLGTRSEKVASCAASAPTLPPLGGIRGGGTTLGVRLRPTCMSMAPGDGGTADGSNGGWSVRRKGGEESLYVRRARGGDDGTSQGRGGGGGRGSPGTPRQQRDGVKGRGGQQEGGKDRPTREQINLNRRLSALSDAESVLQEVEGARVAGVDLNVVNFATALSKLAKSRQQGGGIAAAKLGGDKRFAWILTALQGKIRGTAGRLDARSIASLVWALSSIRAPGTDTLVVNILSRISSEELESMEGRALSTIAWAAAKRSKQLGEETTGAVMDSVASECERRGPESVSPQDVSNLMWAFATLRVYARGVLNLVDGAVGEGGSRASDWSSQSLSNVMWGLAKLGVKRCMASEAVAREAARRNLEGFSSQELSNLVWGATIIHGKIEQDLVESVEAWLASNTFVKPQHLTVTLWSFAKSGVSSPLLYRHAEAVVTSVSGLADFQPQAISNLAWSFATVGMDARATFDAIETSIFERRLDDFKPQEVANLAWAFSKAGLDGDFNDESPGVVWTCVEETMSSRGMDLFEPAHVSMIAWACARKMRRLMAPPGRFVGRSSSRERSISPRSITRDAILASIMSMIATHLKEHGLGKFKPQELSILAWSFSSTGGLACPQVLQDLVAEIQLRDLLFFSSQGLTNIAWAYAHWLQGPNNMVLGLFGSIDAEIASRGVSSMRVAELSVIAWAFAKTGYKDGSMLGLMHDSICGAGSLDAYNEQNLVMCLWALSCTEHSSKVFLDMVEDEILDRGLEAFKAREINAAVFALSKAKHASQRLWDAIDEEAGERARSVDRFEVGETLRDYSLDASHVDDHHEAGTDPTESSWDEVQDDQGGERRGRHRNRRQ